PARHLGRSAARDHRRRGAAARGGRQDGRQRGLRGARPGHAGRGTQADRRRHPYPVMRTLLAAFALAAACTAWAQAPAPTAAPATAPAQPPALAPDVAWPRERTAPDGTKITVYQPQLE